MSVPIVSDGTNGAEGIEGRAIRTVKWVPGETYHNDAPTASAPRYIDVLLIFDASGAVTTRYQCVATYTSGTSETAPTGDGNAHWTKVNNMGPLYTPMFMADNGDITFLSSNQILVKKADGTVTAGVSGAGTGSTGYRFWAGSDVPGDAPFSVDELGRLHSSNADIEGKVISSINGNRIIIDPETESLKMINEYSQEVLNISFEFIENSYIPLMNLFHYTGNGGPLSYKTIIEAGSIECHDISNNKYFSILTDSFEVYKNGISQIEIRRTVSGKYTMHFNSLPIYSEVGTGDMYIDSGFLKIK